MRAKKLFVTLWALFSGAVVVPVLAQSVAPLAIISPLDGSAVSGGQSLPVTVSIASGTYPTGIAIVARDPLGVVYASSVTTSTVALSLPVPANAPPGSYTITAAGMDATGTFVSSAPINLIVDRADAPTTLSVLPAVKLRFIGDTLPITVFGTFAGGLQLDVTHSQSLSIAVADPSVATVQNGVVTAVGLGQGGLGQTTITLQYGQATATIAVTLPLGGPAGDLNGDGRIDQLDVNIILAAINTPANGPNDARDLNKDGTIDSTDVSLLTQRCTYSQCTSQSQ